MSKEHTSKVAPRSALLALGACAGVYLSAKLLEKLAFWATLRLGPVRVDKYKGEWAVVTGGSYGVGKAIANSLAKRGMNLVLVARSEDKLRDTSAEIQSQHGVAVKTISADLAQPEGATHVAQGLGDLPVTVLICNQGGGVPGMKKYWDYTDDEERYCRLLNGDATHGLVKKLLPRMIDRGKGAVVAISSLAPETPMYMAAYSSEKAGLNALMTGLHDELHGTGVTAQSMVLGGVVTPGLLTATGGKAKPSLMMPHPDVVGEAIVRCIGKGGPVVTPYGPHAVVQGILGSIWPPAMRRHTVRKLGNQFKTQMMAVAGATS